MKLKKRKWSYETLWLPRYMFRPRHLFSRWSWMSDVTPSFPTFFRRLWDNMMVFLTPWYSWRRSMLTAFYDDNDTKLLDCGRSFAHVRTRDSSCAYYTLRCGLLRARLTREVLVRKSTGEACNAFLAGIGMAFGMTDDSPDDYESTAETVASGMCLTHGQCERLLNRIIDLTPDMGWDTEGSDD